MEPAEISQFCAEFEEAIPRLRLPDDLTPHTKMVMNKIYQRLDENLRAFYNNITLLFQMLVDNSRNEFNVNVQMMVERQKSSMRHFIENLLRNDLSTIHEVSCEESHQPENANGGRNIGNGGSGAGVCVNCNAGRRTTGRPVVENIVNDTECPVSLPHVRQRFTNHLRELHHILESVLCRQEVAESVREDEELECPAAFPLPQ